MYFSLATFTTGQLGGALQGQADHQVPKGARQLFRSHPALSTFLSPIHHHRFILKEDNTNGAKSFLTDSPHSLPLSPSSLYNPAQIFDAFCSRKALSTDSVRFLFDGQRINPNMTPKDVSFFESFFASLFFFFPFPRGVCTRRGQEERVQGSPGWGGGGA